MNILLVENCSDAAMVKFLTIVQNILGALEIIIPILAIIGLLMTFIKYVTDPENKKLKNRIRNTLVGLVVVFFVPMMVDVVMSWIPETEGFQIKSCWQAAKEHDNNNSSNYYDDGFNDNRKDVIKK